MHLITFVAGFTTLLSLVCGGYIHHEPATSYAIVTKHEEPHHYVKYIPEDYHKHGLYGGLYGSFGDSYDYDHHYAKDEPYHHPKYEFNYGVKDTHTGDIKEQWEHRDGGNVKGGYSLKETDGTTRVVEYTADDHNGFNAVVKKIGHAYHPQVHHQVAHLGGYGAGYGAGYGYDQGHYLHGHHGYSSSYVNVKQH